MMATQTDGRCTFITISAPDHELGSLHHLLSSPELGYKFPQSRNFTLRLYIIKIITCLRSMKIFTR